MSTSPEALRPTHEHESTKELESAGRERREALRETHEAIGEQSKDRIDEARREAIEKARSVENISAKKHEKAASPAERRTERMITQKDRDASFNATMNDVRTHMTPASRTFSQTIHNKTVEKVSEAAGSTIARPNAILSGAVMAFILTLALYLVAKNLGYVLSGFETIGAFILGWVLGLLFDFLHVMITGRR